MYCSPPKPVNLIIICFMDLNDLEGRHRNIIFCWWCLLGNKGTIHTNTIIELNIIHRCQGIISMRGWWRICILCISVRLRTIWRLIGIQPLVRTHNDFPFPMYSSKIFGVGYSLTAQELCSRASFPSFFKVCIVLVLGIILNLVQDVKMRVDSILQL